MEEITKNHLAELQEFLLVVFTALIYEDLVPTQFAKDIFQEIESKKLSWQENIYVPNIIHIFIPLAKPKKIQELETIFNSKAFYQHIYAYIKTKGYKLFDFLRTEIDVLPGVPTKQKSNQISNRCLVRLEWPNHKQTPSGLDVIVEANPARIIKVSFPKTEVSPLALLQPINVRAFREYFLIAKKTTYLGRARNVFSNRGESFAPNDFAFARTSDAINKTISRRHACIEFRDGTFFLKDCKSRLGTTIQRFQGDWKEIPVPTNDEGIALTNNDIIRLGMALVSFEHVHSSEISNLLTQLHSQGYLDTGKVQESEDKKYHSLRFFAKLISQPQYPSS
jgi:hypothetical protein